MMIYTSGTTGRPKAAQLTHRNILFITDGFVDGMPKYDDPHELLSYLPLAHIYENLVSVFMAIWQGSTVNFVESLDTLAQNLREVSPTIFLQACPEYGKNSHPPSGSVWTIPLGSSGFVLKLPWLWHRNT